MDVHFHVSNYAYQGVSLKTLVDQYMGHRIIRSVIMPLPLQQKWDAFEHYAQDRLAPTYYLGPKAELYYYAFADAMIAREYGRLSSADRARLDPMITGFNPMDLYAVHHIKRVLLTFPGVFSGIGEFTVHKELVSNKIAGDPIETITTQGVPPDVAPGGKLSLQSPALGAVLDLVAETGMVATLHNDVYETDIRYDGTVRRVSPARTYVEALKQLCARSPAATVIWAHTGLGRFVKPAADHLAHVASVLDGCPAWSVDISWDLVQQVIVHPEAGMPSLSDWGRFITPISGPRVVGLRHRDLFTQSRRRAGAGRARRSDVGGRLPGGRRRPGAALGSARARGVPEGQGRQCPPDLRRRPGEGAGVGSSPRERRHLEPRTPARIGPLTGNASPLRPSRSARKHEPVKMARPKRRDREHVGRSAGGRRAMAGPRGRVDGRRGRSLP